MDAAPALKRKRLQKSSLLALSLSDSRTSLWLEGNELVHVRHGAYVERSKYFALNDIQAIVITRTYWRAVGNAILGILAAIWVFISLAVGWTDPISYLIFAPLAVLSLLLLAANHFRGPACTTRLHTAVQIEDLSGCRRLKRAQSLLRQLEPEIARIQGAWPGPGEVRS